MAVTVKNDCAKMSDKVLIKEVRALYKQINVVECFGCQDQKRFDRCWAELVERGYSLVDETETDIVISGPYDSNVE